MGSVKLVDSAAPFVESYANQAGAIPQSNERFEIAAAFIERTADLVLVNVCTAARGQAPALFCRHHPPGSIWFRGIVCVDAGS